MTKVALRNITGTFPDELRVKKNYFISNYDADASNLEDALDSVERGQGDLKAFLLAVGASRHRRVFYELLSVLLELECDDREYSDIDSDDEDCDDEIYRVIAKENPYVLPTIALNVEAEIISIKPNTQLFKSYDLSKPIKSQEEALALEATVAPALTGPSPERIQEIGEHLKRYSGVDLPKGDIHTVLTFLFDKLRIPIKVQPGEPVVLYRRRFLDTLAVHIVGQPNESRCPHLFNYWASPLQLHPSEWCMSCAARMVDEKLAYCASSQLLYLTCFKIPPRDIAYPEVVRQMCIFFKKSEKPTYPDWLKNMLAAAPSDPNEGQTPAQKSTAGRSTISSSNSEGAKAGATDARSTNTAYKLPEVMTDAEKFWANMRELIRSEVNAALRAKSDNKGGVTKSRAKSTPLTQTSNTRRGGNGSVTPAQRAHSGAHRAANVKGGK